MAPPGNSENVVALAAILRNVLSPGGSSEFARATRLATLARSAGYVLRQKFMDFGAEVHLVCPAHKHLLRNVTKLTVLWQLETAGGDLTLDTIEGLAL